MKKFYLLVILTIIASMLLVASPASGLDGGGTQGDPYLVSSCADLLDVDDDLTAYYSLTTSIDCTGNGDNAMIGDFANTFIGSFDGGGNSITVALNPEADQVGLFSNLDGAEVFDLTVNGSVTGISRIGGLAGSIVNSTITNVVSNANVESFSGRSGGITGEADGVIFLNVQATGDITFNGNNPNAGGAIGEGNSILVEDSFATGDVTGNGESSTIGGFTGSADCESTIRDTYATGNVNAPNSTDVGGLIGHAGCEGDGVFLERAYATGNVTGSNNVGGLIGFASRSTVQQSFSTGAVNGQYNAGGLIGMGDLVEFANSYTRSSVTADEEGDSGDVDSGGFIGESNNNSYLNIYATGLVLPEENEYVGGLIGYRDEGSTANINSFWDEETTGQSDSDGGTPKTTAEMKDLDTFTDVATDGLDAPWDFEEIWSFTNGVNNNYACLLGVTPGCSDLDNSGSGEGPNNGDGNNDGIQDSEQENVNWILSPITNQYVVIELDDSCEISELGLDTEEANSADDMGYQYPVGLINFVADCGEPGYETQVKLFFYNLENADFTLRKYNPTTNAYFNVEGATLGSEFIDALKVLTATYSVADGGALDVDGTANGIIVDPVGLGQLVVGAPRTGAGGTV